MKRDKLRPRPRPAKPKRLTAAEELALESARQTSKVVREWRRGGKVRLTREGLAAATGRCPGTVRNWERENFPKEPRVSDVRQMERVKRGLVKRLFPESFPRRAAR